MHRFSIRSNLSGHCLTPHLFRSQARDQFTIPCFILFIIVAFGILSVTHQKLVHTKTCIQELVAQALKAVGLSGVEPLFPGELSGGMKKRVALARAIIRDNENDHAEQVHLIPF